ncbi:MAG TPA: RagB/SusD family nutrient uptake outer membrane protein [Bacteroidales bacterium]|nr:RagB/SusD family nutrient uptake outer membrane protein [Bacteroidales bacterium]
MKKILIQTRKWLLIVPVFLALFACNEKLDLKPQQSIDAGTALTSAENIKTALVGAYLEARSANLFGSQFNEFSELYAATSDLSFIGTYAQPREFVRKEVTVTNSYVENTWISAYSLINICNNLLDANTLEILEAGEERDLVEGEAKFLRGWVMFEMVRFFGLPYQPAGANTQLGVPIVLTPTKDVEDAINVPRNSVQECYNQAIADLIAARDLLPEDNGVFASTYAASAVLARLYLQQGDYINAATEANNVIESGLFELTALPLQPFNIKGSSPEVIFALQNNIASNTAWLTVMYGSLNGMGRGDYDIQPGFLIKFDPADLRGMLQTETQSSFTIANINKMYYIGVGTILNNGGINTSKWGDYYANIPLIRLAEMYLIRAEANFEKGGSPIGPNTPTQDINLVRARSLAPEYPDPVTQAQIRNERYFELCWEGHRLHDLKRWNSNIGSYPYNAGNLVLPIPFREMEVNDLLEQNPWYIGG